jgi:hypothetical protein
MYYYMKIFCHHPVPATISSLQIDPISRWPYWLPGQTLVLPLGKQLQATQFTNTPIFLFPIQIYRVWLAPSLTIWTEMEFGEGSGFEPATTECWNRALYPLHHGDFGTFIIQLPCIVKRNSLLAPSTMEVLIILHQSFEFHEEHFYVDIVIPKCFILSM